MSQSTNQIVKLRIRSNDESWTFTIQCLVVDSMTSPLPASDINVSDWNIPKHLRLADPQFNISKEIGILLSSDIVFNVLCSGKIPPRHRKLPFILNSKLGWLFAGACESMSQPNSANSLFTVHVANQLDEQEQLNNSWYYLEVPDVSSLSMRFVKPQVLKLLSLMMKTIGM